MNQQLPSVFSRPSRGVAATIVTDLGAGAHPRISIRGNRFTLVDAAGVKYPWPQLYLDVVIIDALKGFNKVYYDGPFVEGEDRAPTCYSDNGIGPSINASQKQARTCAECPKNAWGSEISFSGKNAKACDDKKKLAVIVIGDGGEMVYELQVPPASIRGKGCEEGWKNLANYSAFVQTFTTPDGSRKADVSDLVTRISFVNGTNGILQFREAAWLHMVGPDGSLCIDANGRPIASPDGGAAIAGRIDDIYEAKLTDDIVGRNDRPWTGEVANEAAAQVTQQAPAQVRGPTPPPVPTSAPAEPARRGRPPKAQAAIAAPEPKPAPAAAPAPAAGAPADEMPAFLRRAKPSQGPVKPQSEGGQGGPSFGMVDAEPVTDAGLEKALKTAFNLANQG